MTALSPRLRAVVDALPLQPGMRVLEIGGAPGAAARHVARRIGPTGHILVIDRSSRAALTNRVAAAEIATGRRLRPGDDRHLLSVRHIAVEDFELLPDERPFDLAFAVRVGALDGRHPRNGELARTRLALALAPGGRLFIDGGDPLREGTLHRPAAG